MPRASSIEEKLLTGRHETLQRTKAFETGIVIAQSGAKIDTILHFAPTPEQEAAKPGVVDADWVLEHATQAARMLPGGLVVLGCYAFAAGAKLSKIEATLQPVLTTLAKRIHSSVAERQALLILLPSDAKKTTCRALSAAAPAKLQPAELKTTSAAAQLVCFTADWSVDAAVSLPSAAATAGASAQRTAIDSKLEATTERLAAAIATVDGALPDPAVLASQLPAPAPLPAATSGGTPIRSHAVALFSSEPPTPPMPLGDEASKPDDAAAAIRLVGVVHGRCFVSPRDDIGSGSSSLPLLLAVAVVVALVAVAAMLMQSAPVEAAVELSEKSAAAAVESGGVEMDAAAGGGAAVDGA